MYWTQLMIHTLWVKIDNWKLIMVSNTQSLNKVLATGTLRRVHHIALNVQDMQASRHFYGKILGLHELTGDEVPKT